MQSTNLNISPIFDDFDEDKNFHRILFNAGKSVQARELTQAQSILQSQIERIGKHLFTEGSMVVPGGINAIEDQNYAKIVLTSGTYADFSSESDLYIKSDSNGLICKVAKTFDIDGSDPISLFLDLLTPGSGQEKVFIADEAATIFVYNSDGSQLSLAQATISEIGSGAWMKVQSGVYFVRGMFVKTEDQQFVVSKYTTDTTTKVGFKVNEQIITATDDATLYSNANGFPNQNSDGATRLKVTLTLTGLDVGAVDKDFIEIARFDGGALASQVDHTQYSIIEKAIAQRTYETNGDYVVNNFGMDIKEHLNDGTNNGVYSVGAGGDSTKLVAAMRPGIGYVKGYRVDNIGIQNVPFDKARDTAFLNNAAYSADYGQYFLTNNFKSLPDIDIKKKILLLDDTATQIGTASVRALRKDGEYYRVYVFDINLDLGKTVSNIDSIKYTDASSLFTADLVTSTLYDANKSLLVFKLPISAVKTLYQSGVGGDTSYTVLRTFNLTTDGSGLVSASVGADEFFGPVDSVNYFVALAGSASIGTQFDPSSSITLGGTIQGTTMTIDLGGSYPDTTIKVVAPVLKSQTTQKTKTLLTITDEVINFPATNRQKFVNADIYDIIYVKDNTTDEDLTSLFTFDGGQRDAWYERGKLIVADSSLIERTVKVKYRYFSHSAGDYFTVDSYTGLTRDQIPTYNNDNLADYIDFRPLKDSDGNFTSSTVFGEILKPNDTVRADITYYLPRSDIIVVNSDGEFKDIRGISSLSPVVPDVPADSMKLYEMYIPAYTSHSSDVIIKTVDNKRYTMRDIGKLETRISNIEYYTTLTALETNTNKTEVIDPVTGNNRFKNGFAVDGFSDYRMADLLDADWSASMDLDNRLLYPSFVQNETGFVLGSVSNAVKPSSVYMKTYTEVPVVSQPYATTTININPYAVFSWVGDIKLSPDRDYWKDVVYSQPIIVNNTINLRAGAVEGSVWTGWIKTTYDELGGHSAWRRLQYKSYLVNTAFQQNTYSSSIDDVVSTSVIPYMRPITIQFTCTGFRPFTRLYPFWDSVDISADCNPQGGSFGDPLVTDSNGALVGYFLVPNRPDKKFQVGESVMKITDSSTDSSDPNIVTTWGSTSFLSGGVTETRQVTTTNTTSLTATSRVVGVRYDDPIAQTFIIPLDDGCFITKFDVYFQSKARDIPVTLQLRTASSGLPTSDILGTVTINPSQVNVSDDATVATSFSFFDPIYLEGGLEYAIVLTADTQEYNVFIAEQGQNIIGSQMALSKQAYMGVFLTSSNSSTWNPEQNKDLMFTAHRASFDTSLPSVITLDCSAPVALPLPSNAIYSTSGSNNVVVKYKSHGLKAGDSVTIAGAVSGNGLPDSDFNGTKVVLSSDIDSFTYQALTNATATGAVGGSDMTVILNYPFNILVNNVDSFSPKGSGVTWEYQYTTQTTRISSGWLPLSPKTNITTPNEGVIRESGDLQIRATLTTTEDNVSPMIESSGFDAVLVSLRVDPTDKVFNYVSADIRFDNPTTQAKFFVGAKLPGSSGMKFYLKVFDTSDEDVSLLSWTEINPVNNITNSDNFVEYEYDLTGSFIGYKIKIELTGSRDNPPSLSDVRSLAFA